MRCWQSYRVFPALLVALFTLQSARAEFVGLRRNNVEDANGTDLIDIQTDPFSMSTIGVSGNSLRLSGLDFRFSTLYATSGKRGSNPGSLFTVDVNTGAATFVGGTGFTAVSGLTADASGNLFGSANIGTTNDDFADRLISIDPLTGAGTLIGTYGAGIEGVDGIDFHPTTGVLYGVNGKDLLTINTSTGAATVLGTLIDTGTNQALNGFMVGLSFDPNGNLFGSIGFSPAISERGSIYQIDIANLEATFIGDDDGDAPVSDLAYKISVTSVPEPSSVALLSLGAVGVLGWRRRRAKAAADTAA